MTFPFFFQPIWKDSIPLFDGGIYDNFPVGPMKDAFHPDFIFGSTVSGGNKKPSENPYNQIETMIMQKTDYEVPEEDGMMINSVFPPSPYWISRKVRSLWTSGINVPFP